MRPYVCSPLRATALHDSRTYFSLNFLRKTGLGMPEMFYGLCDFFFFRYISIYSSIILDFFSMFPLFPLLSSFLSHFYIFLFSSFVLSSILYATYSNNFFSFFLFISLFPSLFLLFVSLMFFFSSFLSSCLPIDRKSRLLNMLGCFMHVVTNIDRKTMK